MSSFIQSNSLSFSEFESRKNKREGILTFGIDFLDDAMAGILKNDLILIGASSGAGKTQTCCAIAKANIEKGKRVHFIALEAEYAEIERRIKYQIFAKHFFADMQRPNVHISFQDWMLGDFLETCAKHEALAASEFANAYANLFTYYKQDKFDLNDLILKVCECADDTDLIIVDHVHYFDFDDENENRAVKEIAKTARTLTLEQGKPIILVSHLRKRDRGSLDLVPGLEEFHGSSDLYKIATKAVTLSPGRWSPEGKYETFFRIVKNRFEGSVTRNIASCNYLTKEGNYEKGYYLGDANRKREDGFSELGADFYPGWARNHGGKRGKYSIVTVKESSIHAISGGKKTFRTSYKDD